MAEKSLEVRDKPSSIDVSQNAKGDHSYSVKIYFNEEDEAGEKVVERIASIYAFLHEKFKN